MQRYMETGNKEIHKGRKCMETGNVEIQGDRKEQRDMETGNTET
jgi:hypothetical protein